MGTLLDKPILFKKIKSRYSVKVGDLVRGSKDNVKAQQKSIALIVDEDIYGHFSIVWVAGEIKIRKILHNFHPDEFEVVSEGR